MASNMVLSGISLAPPSTIMMASLLPATVRCISLTAVCSTVGLIISLPSIIPTTTPAMGPLNGILLTPKATEAPIIAVTSGRLSCSTDITVATMWISFLKPLGNRGLMGLSINLAVKVASSVGLPSLFINPPGIFPTAYCLSSKSTVKGKKSIPSRGSLEAVAVTSTTVSP